jgi:gamma-glutamylcyclotransferase (GGCT)/AIG2-like uncharacterized protein YtfP
MKEAEILKVFVYGTLKPGERNYAIYCQNKVIEIDEVYTQGYLYHLMLGYPAMILGEGKVRGYLLSFGDETVLKDLDHLENYDQQRSPQNNQYLRQELPIYQLTGKPCGQAWGYIMTPDTVKKFGGKLLPSGWWQSGIF